MKLSELKKGSRAKILSIKGTHAIKQHLLDMGLIAGTVVTLVKFAPFGDPVEIRVRGYELTISLLDAKKIEVEPFDGSEVTENIENKIFLEHPGFGEGGIYHNKNLENPLPNDTILTFALIGNQNSGKTTLFNQLTGSFQRVGNFPGVTIDRKEGIIKGHPYTILVDLPGIYSMSPYSGEEILTRNFLLEEKPRGIINVIDSTSIERGLYLTMQLLELNIPMVLALNMMDEISENGGGIYVNEMEKLLKIPVVPISAIKNEGIKELISHAIHVAKYQEFPKDNDFCSSEDNNGNLHSCIHSIMYLIEQHAKSADIPLRFAASKLVEGDNLILEKLNLDKSEKDTLKSIIKSAEKSTELDSASMVADMRYNYIEKICKQFVIKPKKSKEHIRSYKIDRILTGKYTGIPLFIIIMALVFWLTFNCIGNFLSGILDILIENCISSLDLGLNALNINKTLHSLIIDGAANGIGCVLSFLPFIVTLFFFLSILEDSGYMARIAFIMDKLLRKIGLSGRSIVPLLIGFGCSVPAVMASRTLPSEKDRKMTILLTPYMSCSAKLPIYVFFTAAFFKTHSALVMTFLYFGGILIAILFAILLNFTVFSKDAVPFVMELPNYRMPAVKNVLHLLYKKAEDFIKRAFTVIFAASIIIWFLETFNFNFELAINPKDSILASIASVISPAFEPLGFGDWRISTAIITGFMAKETVVSTLSVLFGSIGELVQTISKEGALSMLVFCLLYTPCVAAIAAIRRELGTIFAILIVIVQTLVAWAAAFLVYNIVMYIGL